MTRKCRILMLVGLLASLSATFGTGSPEAYAASMTAWRVEQLSEPTILPPGSSAETERLHLVISNVGGMKAAAGATVTDSLSGGIVPGSGPGPYEHPFFALHGQNGECAVAGQEVTCEVGYVIPSGGRLDVTVPVSVEPAAPPTATSAVTVSSPGARSASEILSIQVGEEPSTFGFVGGRMGLSGVALDEAGSTPTAGSHPYFVELSANVPTVIRGDGSIVPSERLKSLQLELPAGLVANPSAVASDERCSDAVLLGGPNPVNPTFCPASSQVGSAYFSLADVDTSSEVFEMVPPPGVPAEFAFAVDGTIVHVRGGLNGDFRLTAGSTELLAKIAVHGLEVVLWGIPSDPRHERMGGAQVPSSPMPFLTMPTSCSESVELGATAAGWLGGQTERNLPFEDLAGDAAKIAGCDQLAFEPTLETTNTSAEAESASGLDLTIHQPQDESLEGRSTAALKDATVTLPEGMTLNPAAANGLGSCSEEQMGFKPEEGKIRFRTTPQTCPGAAKIGTLEAHTPLLESVQPGSIYVAKPFENPFGSLLAIYLVVEDEETGIVAKLAGKVSPDTRTGRLTATFTENPELPIEDFDLHFFSGDRAALTTPLSCGAATTTSTLTPWSSPEGADAHPSATFQGGTGCSTSEAAAPKTVRFTAGTTSPLAGAYSPFVLRISRPDASQHIAGIATTLPEGLLGKLAGIPYCPESAIANARSREAPEKGRLELASPSCPVASEVGTVNVTAGAGDAPIPVSGRVYLAGPYNGAPLSLVVVVPAVAGPFDLGTVVDRVALSVGEYDARIHAVADPLPTILDGISLDIRSIELKLSKPGFALNPTSCEAKQVEGSFTTAAGQSSPLVNGFQVGDCAQLAFKPSLRLSLKGATGRTGHPALTAVVTFPKQGEYANIRRAQVSLPHSEFLDQGDIGKACTRPLLAAHSCPASSIYGRAKAWTPLLERPLEGPVYLVGGFGYKLPALVAELDGQIRVLLAGKVDTGPRGAIRNTFEAVPDAPVSRFVIKLKGGRKYGLLENSEDICAKKQVAGVSFRAQNGRRKTLRVRVARHC